MCYIFASISKNAFAKIVLWNRNAAENGGIWELAPKKFFVATPSRALENALLQNRIQLCLYTTSENYWGAMPSLPCIYGPG